MAVNKNGSPNGQPQPSAKSVGCGLFLLFALVVAAINGIRGCMGLEPLGATPTPEPTPSAIVQTTPTPLPSVKAALSESQQARVIERGTAYQNALRKVVKEFSKVPYVVAAEGNYNKQPDSIKLTFAGGFTQDEIRQISKTTYEVFVSFRYKYLKPDAARQCHVFIYDESGRRLAHESAWSN